MIISIEGNIGSGKTTLVSILKEELKDDDRFVFISEPVDIWLKNTDKNGESMLTKFYNNQEKYAFPFQIMAYFSRLHLIREARKNNPNKVIITERCVYTDRNVFAKMLYEDGKIEDVCYNIYLQWFDEFMEGMDVEKIIYVDTQPSLCHERINKRKREGESTIPLEYLEKCGEYHQKWISDFDDITHIIQGHGGGMYGNLLTLDGNQEFETDTELFDQWKGKILAFIGVKKKPESYFS